MEPQPFKCTEHVYESRDPGQLCTCDHARYQTLCTCNKSSLCTCNKSTVQLSVRDIKSLYMRSCQKSTHCTLCIQVNSPTLGTWHQVRCLHMKSCNKAPEQCILHRLLYAQKIHRNIIWYMQRIFTVIMKIVTTSSYVKSCKSATNTCCIIWYRQRICYSSWKWRPNSLRVEVSKYNKVVTNSVYMKSCTKASNVCYII